MADQVPARRPVPRVSVSTGAVVAVLVGGVVLTALLAAVAVTAVSVVVAAVVLRSLLRDQHRR
ncbi:SpdD protein [Streptomyces sp. DHE17-7]|uniref:SpdD protein n=1 Tax=Streptomyces sp. DHE17-7 TaxID=2759949 RepID=UPI003FA6AF31